MFLLSQSICIPFMLKCPIFHIQCLEISTESYSVIFRLKTASLLTLGNSNTFDCPRLIAAFAPEINRPAYDADNLLHRLPPVGIHPHHPWLHRRGSHPCRADGAAVPHETIDYILKDETDDDHTETEIPRTARSHARDGE